MIGLAGFLSQNYLESALKGGQGPTKDLEYKLAQELKDNKLSLLSNKSDKNTNEKETENNSDNLLIISSDIYSYPSEEYLKSINGFFNEVQTKIDNTGVNEDIGNLEDYEITPSEDYSTILLSAPFVRGDLISPLMHLTEDYSNNDFKYYYLIN